MGNFLFNLFDKYLMCFYNDNMQYNGVKFEAIVATPGCGKSFLCDKYPELFVDVDEERLKSKYIVPEDISRSELERTKGDRDFPRKLKHDEYIEELYQKLDRFVEQGKTLIAAPHPEAIDYFVLNNIKFCFVFPKETMKEEISRRMKVRGNLEKFITENENMFEEFLIQNRKENKSVIHYEFGQGEFLQDIIKKFGYKF